MDAEDLRKKLIQLTKKDMKEKYASSEAHIIKATSLIESLDDSINLLTEQLREWHAVHFPELNQLVKSNDTFVELVVKLTERKNFDLLNVMGLVQDTILAEKIIEAAKDSAGEDTGRNELTEIKSIAEKIFELKKERKQLTEFIDKTMKEKWPHVTAITGSMLGAKMVAKIGSAKKFAFSPSSTVQLIGAEKALFLHIKKGTLSPKFGYLFTHPDILNAHYKEKGKLARKMAGKISIAAKQDFFARKDAQKIIEKDTKQEKEFKEKRMRKKEFEKRFERGTETETDSGEKEIASIEERDSTEKKPFEYQKQFGREKFQREFRKEQKFSRENDKEFQKPFEGERKFPRDSDREFQKPFGERKFGGENRRFQKPYGGGGFHKHKPGFKPFRRDSDFRNSGEKRFQKPYKEQGVQKPYSKESDSSNSSERKGFQPFNKRREFQNNSEEGTGFRKPFNRGSGFHGHSNSESNSSRPFNRGHNFHGKPKHGFHGKPKFGKKKW